MSIPVKWFTNNMRGAPTLSGTPSALIALLDACLITGFGPVTPTGITIAGGIATATLPSGQSFDEHAVVLVSGATPATLNGEARVLTSSSTQITFATTAADGAASGSIEIRYAPVGGWEKKFSGTNLAVYRSTDPQSNGHHLRVDDAGTTTARVRGCETMTDVNTGAGPFPTDAHMSGGGYWHKSTQANATPARWRLFADSRMVLPAVAAGTAASGTMLAAPLRGFGEPIALRPSGDAWGTVLACGGSSAGQANFGALDVNAVSGTVNGMVALPRAVVGLGGSINTVNAPLVGTNSTTFSGNDPTLGAFPSDVDGQLKLCRRFIRETAANNGPRSLVPGLLHVPQSGLVSVVSDGDIVIGQGDLAGRRLMAIHTGSSYAGGAVGVYFVDITGPWR